MFTRLKVMIPPLLGLLVLWAAVASDGGVVGSADAAGQIVTTLLFVAVFSALAFNVIGRLEAVSLGAVGALALGIVFGFYVPSDAGRYLVDKSDTLAVLVGVGAVTALLDEAGLFARWSRLILSPQRQSPRRTLIRLCLLTYALSMFVNNLAAILVIIPISLRIADAMDMDPIPLVLGEVIASNLGGASTMVGDFPNILIATDMGIPFHFFLLYMAPICALQLAVLLAWLAPTFSDRQVAMASALPATGRDRYDRARARRGQLILAAMIAGFLASGWLPLPPAAVAISAGIGAFAFGGIPPRRLLAKMSVDDLWFFACLFILVGAVAASGILDGLEASLGALWAQSPLWGALAVTWSSAALTCFLNAGPTTALMIHVLVIGLGPITALPTVWWALSLGVCAGSSGTLTGATAGPVAVSLVERQGLHLSFATFARTGIPVMVMFLALSSAYLAILIGT